MVWEGDLMKIEFQISSYDYDALKNISDYSELEINDMCRRIILGVVKEFESKMREFLEMNYIDDYE